MQLEDLRQAREKDVAEARVRLDETLSKLDVANASIRDRDQQLEDLLQAHETGVAEARVRLDETLRKLDVANASIRDRDQQLEDLLHAQKDDSTENKFMLDEALMKLENLTAATNSRKEEIAAITAKMKQMDVIIKSQADEIAVKNGIIEQKTSELIELENKAFDAKIALEKQISQHYNNINQESGQEIEILKASNETLVDKVRSLGLSDLKTKDDLSRAEEALEIARCKLNSLQVSLNESQRVKQNCADLQNEIRRLQQQNMDLSVNMQAQIDQVLVQVDSMSETHMIALDQEKLELETLKEEALKNLETKSGEVLSLSKKTKEMDSHFHDQLQASENKFNELISVKDQQISNFEELIENMTEEGDIKMNLLKDDLEISEKRTYDALTLVDDREEIIQSLTYDVEGLRTELRVVENEIFQIETRESSMKKEVDCLKVQISDLQEEARNAKDNQRGEIEVLFAELKIAKDEKEALEIHLRDSIAAKDELENEICKLRTKYEEKDSLLPVQECLSNEKMQRALEAREGDMRQLMKQLEQTELNLDDVRRAMRENDVQWKDKCSSSERTVCELSKNFSAVSNELEACALAISSLESDLFEKEEINVNLRKELISAELKMAQMHDCKLHTQLHNAESHIEDSWEDNNSRIDVAQEMSRQLENTRGKLVELKQQLKLRGFLPSLHEEVGYE